MQLKNKNILQLFQPGWQIPGIFITSFTLAFLQYANSAASQLAKQESLAYARFLFFAVLLFYSADHFMDLRKVGKENELSKKFQKLNLIVIAVSSICLVVVFFKNMGIFNFLKIWILAIPLFLYGLGAFKLVKVYRGIREALISIVVAIAIEYPVVQTYQWYTWYPVLAMAVICSINLLIFSWFEIEKDEYFGFPSVFVHRTEKQLFWFIGCFFFFAFLFLLWLQMQSSLDLTGHFIALAAYLFMLLSKKIWNQHPVYRWIADMILLLTLI